MVRFEMHSLSCRDAHCSWCKTNLKLELCDSVLFGKPCRHGYGKCSYAHSPREIDLPTVKDRVKAGLIKDEDTFRTKPCFDFVATGYCPYGNRCNSIHDPDAAVVQSQKLSSPTWHLKSLQLGSDFKGTDVHVDWNFDAKRNVVNNHELELHMASYDSFFSSIIPPVSRDNAILHKLTLLMMKKRTHKHYFKYVPKHKLQEKLCMVVSKAFFRITDRQNLSFEEIDLYNPRDSSHFSIHEVAFAAYGSSEETMNMPLYFINLSEALLTPISFFEVKAINNAKKKLKDDLAKEMVWGVCSPCASKKVQFTNRTVNQIVQDMQRKKQVLASSHSLYFHDKYLHELVTDLLELKVDTLLSSSHSSSPALALEKKFEEVKMFVQGNSSINAWPNTFGHRFTNSYTMIPCTEVAYKPADGTFYADLWSSFTDSIQRERRAWENNGQVSRFVPMMSATRLTQKKLDNFEFDHLEDFSTDFVEDLLKHWEHVGEKHIKKEHNWAYANTKGWSK